jgi:hypothetical protein
MAGIFYEAFSITFCYLELRLKPKLGRTLTRAVRLFTQLRSNAGLGTQLPSGFVAFQGIVSDAQTSSCHSKP